MESNNAAAKLLANQTIKMDIEARVNQMGIKLANTEDIRIKQNIQLRLEATHW